MILITPFYFFFWDVFVGFVMLGHILILEIQLFKHNGFTKKR